MDGLPTQHELIEVLTYPLCWLAGLFGGLITRRLLLAVAIAFILAPMIDIVGSMALSSAHPYVIWSSSLKLAVTAGFYAVVVWALARAVRMARR